MYVACVRSCSCYARASFVVYLCSSSLGEPSGQRLFNQTLDVHRNEVQNVLQFMHDRIYLDVVDNVNKDMVVSEEKTSNTKCQITISSLPYISFDQLKYLQERNIFSASIMNRITTNSIVVGGIVPHESRSSLYDYVQKYSSRELIFI